MKENNKNEKKDFKLIKRCFKLLEYLRKNTDREHPVIQARLREAEEVKEYLGTHDTFNKTVSRLAEVLNSDEHGIRREEEWVLVYKSFRELYGESGDDTDKESKLSSIKDIYFNHIFSNDELTVIINALRTSKAVDNRRTDHIIEKLTGRLAPKFYDEPVYRLHIPEFTDSPQLAHNLGIIQKAISEGKKLSFQFNFYNGKGVLTAVDRRRTSISPHYIVSDHGRLYLIGGFENGQLCVYRIDLMTDVHILQRNKHSISSTAKHLIDGLPSEMSDEFKAKQLYMSYEKPMTVQFKNTKTCRDGTPNYTFIHDTFGDHFTVIDSKENIVRVRSSEFGILIFAMQYGEYVEILEPLDLRQKVAGRVRRLGEKYLEGK